MSEDKKKNIETTTHMRRSKQSPSKLLYLKRHLRYEGQGQVHGLQPAALGPRFELIFQRLAALAREKLSRYCVVGSAVTGRQRQLAVLVLVA